MDVNVRTTGFHSHYSLQQSVADPDISFRGGTKVERRRRENRGTEGAEGVGRVEGVSPSPLGLGLKNGVF